MPGGLLRGGQEGDREVYSQEVEAKELKTTVDDKEYYENDQEKEKVMAELFL